MAAGEPSEMDKILERTDLEPMLEFETELFLDIVHQDGLVVAAKGLNLDLVLINLLKIYCDPGNLVLVLNSTDTEDLYFKKKLDDSNVHVTTFSTNTVEREDLYLSGGIHFITTRILVVDMLKKRIPIDKITGFIILRAHTVLESCQEAFVLRLFRQENKTGFVKAFSNSSQSFTVGFGHVERVMRALFVKELYIWPRFHSTVIKSLKPYEVLEEKRQIIKIDELSSIKAGDFRYLRLAALQNGGAQTSIYRHSTLCFTLLPKPKVVELHIPLTEGMTKIQTYLLELMNLTVKELKRINKTVELQEITVENCLTKKFHKILQLQLDVIWNQLSTKSRQLVVDLKTLRHLLITMLYSDPVTFYAILQNYKTREYAQTATWVLLEPAELLFLQATALVFTGDREFNPQFSPKWSPLLELLKVEIPNEIKKSDNKDNKILILCNDYKICYQLQQLLTTGPHQYLFLEALKRGINFNSINETFKNCGKLSEEPPEKKAKSDGETDENNPEPETHCTSFLLTMSQTILPIDNETTGDDSQTTKGDYIFEPFKEMENMNLTQICESLTCPTILIQTFKGVKDYINLQRTLDDIKPSFIIMYHSNVTAIREIEMYEAHRQRTNSLKVYFLIHAETVEEQSYLTALRREKEAFEYLIKTKSTMVVPEDQDGKSDLCLALQRDMKSPTKSTRQGGKTDEPPTKRKFIIVDMREFRSELPALIHKRGIDIEPVTITVGDYILTSEICVERKSLSDLIGSLNSGRLYQQCTQMSRYYPKPMLLIEFDQNKPFSWQNHYMVSSDSSNFDIQQKLLLLTLHFPKLKLIWSPSPYATAQLFEELKDGKDEPNIEFAAAIGGEQDLDMIEAKYNSSIYDFIQKLPGINSKNIDAFLRQVQSLDNALGKDENELKEILGNLVDAKAFHSILHEDHNPKEEPVENKQKAKAKSRFKFVKKKQ